ncbi:uncharacterized protein LOC122140731 [Cyprinus carpio]|uniref:Uncharacterized protein LOC122140731 n=1 Tax=Cyprinus carpio TaxID=7962 RepID=A0A9R0ALZ7_CYPCA|nr:uncharacterized protein LOC122140731 [Cyprinus carpio]
MFEFNRGKPVSTALSAKLTNLLAQWIATSCRPISVVEDDGLELVLQAATGVTKTEERHFAEECARQFLDVTNQWGIADKISTIRTDSAPNMVAAGRILPFEHLPCVAHVVQRAIVMSLREGVFDGALAKWRKVVRLFKHSPANSDELNVQQPSLGQVQEPLVQDVPTRWNSTLEIIKHVRHNRDALHTMLSQQKHNLALPTNAEYEKLANF